MTAGSAAHTMVTGLFEIAGTILATPISAVAFILLYYDLRIRKEGFDLEMLSQTLGGSAPAPPPVEVR